jgi:hypothetical protein
LNMKYTLKYFVYPFWMNNDTLPIGAIKCVVSLLVYINCGVLKSFTFLNYFSMSNHVI